ncbi:MAG: IS256 family transposase [candidate division Zixibacteria bacterium]|nr:IS256 family transposase [candidate division Zixibacteria bacterium]
MVDKRDEADKLIDEMIAGKTPEEIVGEGGLLQALTKRVYERALEGEMTHHLGYPPKAREGRNSGNSRNGKTSKTVKTGAEDVNLSIPRDRNGEFEPHLVKKHQRRLPGFDAKVLALYARGLTTRDIQGHLEEMYDSDVSPALISAVTDAVLEEVTAWQSRPLEAVYPIVYLDAIHLKMRHSGQVKNQAVYLALGINPDGYKELLGLWIGEHEGAKFWLNVLTQLKNRGVQDILIACVDGLTGFPDAIETAYPKAQVQLCIVHMVRNSLKYVSWKERKAVAADLKTIYSAPNVEAAEESLTAFEAKYQDRFPQIARSWRSCWMNIIPFFGYPPEIRKVIYTTNAIESMNSQLRKVTRNRGSFPTADSVRKVIYLALQRISKKWKRPIKDWVAALNHFCIVFEGRI